MAHIASNEPVIDPAYIELARQVNAQRVIIPGSAVAEGWRDQACVRAQPRCLGCLRQ